MIIKYINEYKSDSFVISKLLVSILLILFVIFSNPCLAQHKDTLVIPDNHGEYSLGLYLEILEDIKGDLSIEDVSSIRYDDQFKGSYIKVPNFGFTDSIYWVRFKLKNQSENREWFLVNSFKNTHFLDFYEPVADRGFRSVKTGILRSVNTRDVDHYLLAFSLSIKKGAERVYYLRYNTESSMTIDLNIYSKDAFRRFNRVEYIMLGVFYGIIVIMIPLHKYLVSSIAGMKFIF